MRILQNNLKLALWIVLLSISLTGCSIEKEDIKVEDVQIKSVKEVSNEKIENQVLNVDGVDIVDDFRDFDEAHFKDDSINIYDESIYVYIELENEDYQKAYIDYLDYMSGRYPTNASCTISKDNYILWEGKGYKSGIQINASDETKNLYVFKWTDEKTKMACNNGLERLFNEVDKRFDARNEILADLDSKYPNIDEELREIFYTNKGSIKTSDKSLDIELNQNNINEIQSIIENSTVDVGDSIADLDLGDKYYIVTLRSNDGIIEYKFVADDDTKEFYIKEGRIIDIEDDRRQNNALNQYLFGIINN